MAYEFQKLSEVEALSEVPEGASVLAEVNGDIKRVPGAGLGGNGGKTLIIVDSGGNSAQPIAGIIEDTSTRFTANMTFDEAGQALYNKELMGVYMYLYNNGSLGMLSLKIQDATNAFGVPCLVVFDSQMDITLFWTADGISTDEPVQEK